MIPHSRKFIIAKIYPNNHTSCSVEIGGRKVLGQMCRCHHLSNHFEKIQIPKLIGRSTSYQPKAWKIWSLKRWEHYSCLMYHGHSMLDPMVFTCKIVVLYFTWLTHSKFETNSSQIGIRQDLLFGLLLDHILQQRMHIAAERTKIDTDLFPSRFVYYSRYERCM